MNYTYHIGQTGRPRYLLILASNNRLTLYPLADHGEIRLDLQENKLSKTDFILTRLDEITCRCHLSAHFTLHQPRRPPVHGPNISPFPLLQRRLVPWLSATQHAPKMVSTLGPSEDKVASKDKSSTMEARSTSHVSFICWHVIWFALYLSIVWNLYFALRDSIFWMEHGHQ